MSQGQIDMTSFDKVLKDVYLGPIRTQLNESTVLMTRIAKTGDYIDASGRKAIIPVQFGWAQGIGARADGGALPTVVESNYQDSTVTIKHNYMRIKITGPTMRASKNDKGAFAKAVDSEIKSGTMALKKDINRQMFSDGTGKIAQVNGVVGTSATVTVDNPGTRNLYAGMRIDIYLSTSKEIDSATILSVDSDTQITLAATGSCTDNAWIYREDSYGTAAAPLEMNGLRGLIDDGTYLTTLQGLLRSTYGAGYASTAYANSGVNRTLTLALMQKCYTDVEQAGYKPTLYTSFGIRDAYVALLVSDKRFVNTMTLDGGFEAVKFNDRPLIPDSQCWKNTIYFSVDELLSIHRQADFSWADEDGSILKYVSGYDAYEAFMYYDAEFANERPNAMSVLKDITE